MVQLKNLYELLAAQKANGHGHEEDAMFAKKPLGGWSCASCEKNLVNLYGNIAEYTVWNKMPQRDPTDRIARVGQGFSRMLAMVKPENQTQSQYLTTNNFNSAGKKPNQRTSSVDKVDELAQSVDIAKLHQNQTP